MSGEAAPRATTEGAVQCTRSRLWATATFQWTWGATGVAVSSLKSMCHSPPDHCNAWSFTPWVA